MGFQYFFSAGEFPSVEEVMRRTAIPGPLSGPEL